MRFYEPDKPLFDKTWKMSDLEEVSEPWVKEPSPMKRAFPGIVALAFTALSSTGPASAQTASDQETYEIARDAYVYAYPLLLMDTFMRQGTNYAEPTGLVTQAPYNQFSHAKAFPPADYKAVVRANVDTLYSAANLDLGPEPLIHSGINDLAEQSKRL